MAEEKASPEGGHVGDDWALRSASDDALGVCFEFTSTLRMVRKLQEACWLDSRASTTTPLPDAQWSLRLRAEDGADALIRKTLQS